jgi:hypothetical protein
VLGGDEDHVVHTACDREAADVERLAEHLAVDRKRAKFAEGPRANGCGRKLRFLQIRIRPEVVVICRQDIDLRASKIAKREEQRGRENQFAQMTAAS